MMRNIPDPIEALICLITGVVLFLIFSCGHPQPLGPGGLPNGVAGGDSTLSGIQAATFGASCGIAPCHVAGGLAPFRLDTAPQSFANLVGVQSLHNPNKNRVTAGDITTSYILDIIQGNGVNGAVMPPGGNNLLSQTQIQQISNWIAAGALNN